MMTVAELYENMIRPLPAADRLELAKLILSGIDPHSVVDYSEEWTDEDLREISLHSLNHAATSFEEDEDAQSG